MDLITLELHVTILMKDIGVQYTVLLDVRVTCVLMRLLSMRALSSRDDCAAGNGTRVVSSTISGIEMPGRENLERAGRLDLRQNLDHLHPDLPSHGLNVDPSEPQEIPLMIRGAR